MRRSIRPAVVALAAALGVAGCGEVKNTITPNPGTENVVTVMLPGPPNGFYVGLYEAEALGYFKATDMDVRIEVPSAGENAVQDVHDGKALVAIASMPTVFLQRNMEEPVVGIAAITHSPQSDIVIGSSAAGSGGCAGGPSGGAALLTTPTATSTTTTTPTTASSASPTATTTTGAQSTATCTTTTPTPTTTATVTGTTTTGTTATTTAKPRSTRATEPDSDLWSATVRKQLASPGVPVYDGLVVVARKDTIVNHAPLLRRFVQALARGYRAARANPVNAVQRMIVQVPALASSATQQLAIVTAAMPYFFPPGLPVWGYQRESVWNAFGEWMLQNHLISDPNAITDASTNELLAGEGV